MKRILLSRGKFGLVDDEDFEKVNKYKWSTTSHNYAYHFKLGYLHRYLMNCPKGLLVDHINKNTLDNRKQNLRIATKSQNAINSDKRKQATSKYKGVYWNKKRRKWSVMIGIHNKHFHLGVCDSEEKAAEIYNDFAIKYHKEFAHLNIIAA